ncbi:MAG: MFS transporter [Thalassobaculales bacterium]
MTPETPSDAPIAGAWRLVWWLSLAQLCSWGTLYYAVTVFVAPMQAELGWSRAELLTAVTIGLLAAGVTAPLVGAWMDRHGGRLTMTAGSLIGGLLMIAWSQVEDLLAFYAIYAGIGAMQALTLYEPAFAVVTANLGAQYRKGITTMTLLGGLASTVFIPLSQFLIDRIGWRDTLVVLGLVNLLLCAGIHLVMLRGTRASAMPPAPGGASPLRRALAMPVFWMIALSFTAYGAVFTGMTFHLIPVLTDAEVDSAWAVAIFAIVGPMQVAGRLAVLWLGRRLDGVRLGKLSVSCLPLSLLLLIAMPSFLPGLFVFAALYGLGNGTMTIVRGTAVPDMVGREAYATLNGAIAAPSLFARAIAPAAFGAVWLAVGGYGPVLWIMFAISLAGAGAFWLAAARAKG